MKHPSREDRIIAIATAEKVLSETAPGAQRDSDRPEPARTSHPTGTGQAAANRDDEPPG